MSLIQVAEPYASPPRIREVAPADVGADDLLVDHGYLDLRDARLGAGDLPQGVEELDLTGCHLDGIEFGAGVVVEARNCRFDNCDLSQVRVRRLDKVAVVGCKLVGTDLSESRVEDAVFEHCLLRYTNLRMARLDRVAMTHCSLHDVDLYEASVTNASFVNSTLDQVIVARAGWSRVDFRGARSLQLQQLGGLDGTLISDEQVIELAYTLALRAGADIESGEEH